MGEESKVLTSSSFENQVDGSLKERKNLKTGTELPE
jgi:hypothetical protein